MGDRLPHRRHLAASNTRSRRRPSRYRAFLRDRHEFQDIWHPADCIGETGAAALPVHAGRRALSPRARGYAAGDRVLAHSGNDDGSRAALVLSTRRSHLMANDVFANGREISCKAGDGKSICAFRTSA